MDGGAWWATLHGVEKSRTRLSDFTFTFHFHSLEKEMATHSSVLAWRISGMGGAWWAAIYGVAQSRTRLKRLSSSSKITADGDCSHEVKRYLLFGRKAVTNLDSILKSRNITLPTKICSSKVKAIVFPVVMYGCDSWTIKKAECRRIDAFELWCWRRLLRVPWTARRLKQSILKEINPEYSLEGLMLKLKLQYFGYLM